MHTPPKTPEHDASPIGASVANQENTNAIVSQHHGGSEPNTPPTGVPLSHYDENAKTSISNITGMGGTSDAFSSISTHSELDADDNFNEAKQLMAIQGKGIIGFLERIPLPVKLVQLSALAILGMLILAGLIIGIRSAAVTDAKNLAFVFNYKNKIYNTISILYDSRFSTVMFMAFKETKYNATVDVMRAKVNSAVTEILQDNTFLVNNRATKAMADLKNAMTVLGQKRVAMDALRSRTIVDSKEFDALQGIDIAVELLVSSMTTLSSCLADISASKRVYTLELISNLRDAVEHVYNDMNKLITLGKFHKNTGEMVEIVADMKGYYDRALRQLQDEMDEELNANFVSLVKTSKYVAPFEQIFFNVTAEIIALRPMPNVSLSEWITAGSSYLEDLKIFEAKWQNHYVQDANNELATSIVLIVLLVVFVIAAFLCICGNSFIMSRTITGPWQRMNYILEQSISKFVPRDFLYLIKCKSVIDVKLGKAQECDLTVMSIDIKYAVVHDKDQSANHVIQVLNQIFGFLGPIVRMHNGYIEKYLSHGAEAIFTHPKNAVYAALDLEKSVDSFNKTHTTVQILSIIIGIHCDKKSVIGTIGEAERMESAIVSSTMKIAQSIKQLAKKLKSKVLISRETLGYVKKSWTNVQYRYLGSHSIVTEDSSYPLRVYELFSDTDSRVKYSKEFSKAVALMDEGNVEDAMKVFKHVANANALDASAAQFAFLCSVLVEESTSESKNILLRDTLMVPEMREAFKKQLVQEYCHENLLLWEKLIDALKVPSTNPTLQREKATKICNEFFAINAKYEMNLTQQIIQQFRDNVNDNSVAFNPAILEAMQAEAENLMLDSFKRFKTSPAAKSLLAKKTHEATAVKL